MDRTYSISEAGGLLGVSPHTLRYYERAGLLGVPRAESRHRRYSDRELSILRFLLHLRSTGMPIALMRRYVELVAGGEATVAARRELLRAHRDAVERQIAALQDDLSAIETKLVSYDRLHTLPQA